MAPIDHPHNNQTSTKPVTSRRFRTTVVTIALPLLLLAGCSTGSAPEAEQGKQEDARNESVISDMQATHTWNLINSTPESTPNENP